MRMKMKSLLCIGLISTFLNGCVTHYNIAPKYDEKNATVFIDNFLINSVTYHQKKFIFPNAAGMVGVASEYFKTNDEQCSSFSVDKYEADGLWHYNSSSNDDVLRQHNGKCNIEKVGNIYFLKCSGKTRMVSDGKESIKKTDYYYINTFSKKDIGYGSKIIIKDLSRTCYNNIKRHFSSITEAK